jgi:hypothetical protein
MKNYTSVGVQSARIFLPNAEVNLQKWAVIACDQFTSQPEYWQGVEDQVGDAPSTLHMILPEIFLGKREEGARIVRTQQTMSAYLERGILTPQDGLILVERTIRGKTRRGIVLALDLERYDFSSGSQSLIRATEGTIIERLPPRVKIRQGASLEIPHILVLIDDPTHSVINPLLEYRPRLKKCYDFELMQDSGHLQGFAIEDTTLEKGVIRTLEKLGDPDTFYSKYNIGSEKGILLFAVGDGNHSLATAKSIWEKVKPQVGLAHPARFALVEIENVHDDALEFEPIHRVLFNIKGDVLDSLKKYFTYHSYHACADPQAVAVQVANQEGPDQLIGLVQPEGCGLIRIMNPPHTLAVGSLQPFLDEWCKKDQVEKIDYVHGDEVVFKLGSMPGNAGFLLPALKKNELFKTVIIEGVLPRKTFSMGEAREKRFYMEARKII